MSSQLRRKAVAEPAVLVSFRKASQQCKYHFERAKEIGWQKNAGKVVKAEKALIELFMDPSFPDEQAKQVEKWMNQELDELSIMEHTLYTYLFAALSALHELVFKPNLSVFTVAVMKQKKEVWSSEAKSSQEVMVKAGKIVAAIALRISNLNAETLAAPSPESQQGCASDAEIDLIISFLRDLRGGAVDKGVASDELAAALYCIVRIDNKSAESSLGKAMDDKQNVTEKQAEANDARQELVKLLYASRSAGASLSLARCIMYLMIPGDKRTQKDSADDTERQIEFQRLCKANRDPIPAKYAASLSNAAIKIKRSYAKSPRLSGQDYMHMLNVLTQSRTDSLDIPCGVPINEFLMDGKPMDYGAKGGARLKRGEFIFYLDAHRLRVHVSQVLTATGPDRATPELIKQIYDEQDEEAPVCMDYDRCREFKRIAEGHSNNQFTWKAVKQGENAGYTSISVRIDNGYADTFEKRFTRFGPKVKDKYTQGRTTSSRSVKAFSPEGITRVVTPSDRLADLLEAEGGEDDGNHIEEQSLSRKRVERLDAFNRGFADTPGAVIRDGAGDEDADESADGGQSASHIPANHPDLNPLSPQNSKAAKVSARFSQSPLKRPSDTAEFAKVSAKDGSDAAAAPSHVSDSYETPLPDKSKSDSMASRTVKVAAAKSASNNSVKPALKAPPAPARRSARISKSAEPEQAPGTDSGPPHTRRAANDPAVAAPSSGPSLAGQAGIDMSKVKARTTRAAVAAAASPDADPSDDDDSGADSDGAGKGLKADSKPKSPVKGKGKGKGDADMPSTPGSPAKLAKQQPKPPTKGKGKGKQDANNPSSSDAAASPLHDQFTQGRPTRAAKLKAQTEAANQLALPDYPQNDAPSVATEAYAAKAKAKGAQIDIANAVKVGPKAKGGKVVLQKADPATSIGQTTEKAKAGKAAPRRSARGRQPTIEANVTPLTALPSEAGKLVEEGVESGAQANIAKETGSIGPLVPASAAEVISPETKTAVAAVAATTAHLDADDSISGARATGSNAGANEGHHADEGTGQDAGNSQDQGDHQGQEAPGGDEDKGNAGDDGNDGEDGRNKSNGQADRQGKNSGEDDDDDGEKHKGNGGGHNQPAEEEDEEEDGALQEEADTKSKQDKATSATSGNVMGGKAGNRAKQPLASQPSTQLEMRKNTAVSRSKQTYGSKKPVTPALKQHEPSDDEDDEVPSETEKDRAVKKRTEKPLPRKASPNKDTANTAAANKRLSQASKSLVTPIAAQRKPIDRGFTTKASDTGENAALVTPTRKRKTQLDEDLENEHTDDDSSNIGKTASELEGGAEADKTTSTSKGKSKHDPAKAAKQVASRSRMAATATEKHVLASAPRKTAASGTRTKATAGGARVSVPLGAENDAAPPTAPAKTPKATDRAPKIDGQPGVEAKAAGVSDSRMQDPLADETGPSGVLIPDTQSIETGDSAEPTVNIPTDTADPDVATPPRSDTRTTATGGDEELRRRLEIARTEGRQVGRQAGSSMMDRIMNKDSRIQEEREQVQRMEWARTKADAENKAKAKAKAQADMVAEADARAKEMSDEALAAAEGHDDPEIDEMLAAELEAVENSTPSFGNTGGKTLVTARKSQQRAPISLAQSIAKHNTKESAIEATPASSPLITANQIGSSPAQVSSATRNAVVAVSASRQLRRSSHAEDGPAAITNDRTSVGLVARDSMLLQMAEVDELNAGDTTLIDSPPPATIAAIAATSQVKPRPAAPALLKSAMKNTRFASQVEILQRARLVDEADVQARRSSPTAVNGGAGSSSPNGRKRKLAGRDAVASKRVKSVNVSRKEEEAIDPRATVFGVIDEVHRTMLARAQIRFDLADRTAAAFRAKLALRAARQVKALSKQSRKIVAPAMRAHNELADKQVKEPLAKTLNQDLALYDVGKKTLKAYIQKRDRQLKAILDMWGSKADNNDTA